MAEDLKMLAGSSCAPTVNSISLPPMLKRKRSDSVATDAPVPTKVRTEDVTTPSSQALPVPTVAPTEPVATPAGSPATATTTYPPAPAAGTPNLDRVRDTITAQLSLEVLLKHNELRLIDQEIAKCQVALEQLRRCAEIPYPGSSVAGMSSEVSAGTGASVWAPGNGPPPLSPAPWGVTEGPYSRHYARWLLPDPRFDGGEVESGASATAGAGFYPLVEGRSTRGNPVDFSSLAGKTRPSRNSTSAKLQALPSGYPVVKEKAGPMLIRRKSDGVLVKLVCLDCRRDNFSSTQGFINHCRIAHNRNFASHDAAAMASGEPVEVDEAGAVIGGRTESTSSAAATPGYVHPLIRSQLPTPSKDAATPRQQSAAKSFLDVATPPATVHAHSQPRPTEPVKAAANPDFLASPATPHLSAFMRDRGLGLNLDKLVTDVKTPIDLSALSDDDSDADESGHHSGTSRETSQQGARAARQPMRMPTVQAASKRSDSRKGLERVALRSQPTHNMTPSRPHFKPSYLSDKPSYLSDLSSLPVSRQHTDISRDGSGLDHPADMSPNTIESNQAPSLVSDDDDYDVATDPDSPSSSEAGDQDQDFRHIEVQDDERSAAPSATSTEDKSTTSLADPTSQPPTLAKPLKDKSKKIMVPGRVESKDEDKPVNLLPAKDASQHDQADPKSAPGP